MYLRAGVPGTILEKHHTSWTIAQIRDILRFYGVEHTLSARRTSTKLELMRRLARLVEERGLTRFDLLEIARYSRGGGGRAGGPRPSQKPVVLQTTAPGGNQDTTISAEVRQSLPTASNGDEIPQQLAQPTMSPDGAPEDIAAQSTSSSDDAPEDIAAQSTSSPDEAPEDIAAESTSSSDDDPEDIAAQSTSSPDEAPEDIAAQFTSSSDDAPENVMAQDIAMAEASNLSCTVCLEDLSSQNFLDRKVTVSCNHEPDVCRPCLSTSISTQFTSKVWNQIDCPTCGERLDFQDVKEFAESEIFER